jgi:prolyl-tRNA editing enzyme YbaK/EbsC (Cys-tRNA(Pro) deacylase)
MEKNFMKLGNLEFEDLEGRPTFAIGSVRKMNPKGVLVAEIDPDLADTAEFCQHYQIGMEVSANCVLVQAKRADRVWYAACVILATTKVDVNGAVRRRLDARKVSFAPMSEAVRMTGMEYGGITPIGLPADWPILIDSQVIGAEHVIIGSGLRKSKLLVETEMLRQLPEAEVLSIAKP